MIEKGTKAPDFELCDQNGQPHKLSDYAGKTVVLYFYPKDSTTGCTMQARGYSALTGKFGSLGAVVIGVSRDSVASHKKFETNNSLTFTLLSDADRAVTEKYGAWQEKKNYGKVSMGVVRTTYVIDKNGVVIDARTGVKAADDPEATLEIVRSASK